MRSRIVREYAREQAYHAVYVIAPSDGRLAKVGIADHPLKRLNGIQSGNWEELRVFKYWWLLGRPFSQKVEGRVKERLADRNIRGEWFSLRPDELAAVVESAAAELGIPLMTDAEMVGHAKFTHQQWVDKVEAVRHNIR